MRLNKFRIVNCFGFTDSGWINFKTPNNLIYILGRNSSGKTSLLNAIRYFEFDYIPSEYENFINFNPTSEESKIYGLFSIEKNDLNSDLIIKHVKEHLEKNRIPPTTIESDSRILELLETISNLYQNLIQKAESLNEILVEKDADGNYIFRMPKDKGEYDERKEKIIKSLNITFPNKVFQFQNQKFQITIDFHFIENQLFRQFPQIFLFNDRFSLSENLPDRINVDILENPSNSITSAFIEYLDKKQIYKFLESNDPDIRESLLKEFNKKVNNLINKINLDKRTSQYNENLLDLVLHENQGLQITLKTDKKKSFYRHLSENTKFLFAYNLYSIVHNLKNAILLFDEPNKGFHPSAQEYIIQFLISLSKYKNSLVILSTHSEYMIHLDYLPSMKIMKSDNSGGITISNHFYSKNNKKGDYLSLLPIFDAIGLRYTSGIKIKDKVIVTEGITDLLYLRAFKQILNYKNELNIAPSRGDGNILSLIPFFISQGIGIRIVIDTGNVTKKIKDNFGIDSKYIWEVPIPAKFQNNVRNSGIEDLFSKNDYKMLIEDILDVKVTTKFSNVPNSQYFKNKPEKRIIAHELLNNVQSKRWKFSQETSQNFRSVLDFCFQNEWFTL